MIMIQCECDDLITFVTRFFLYLALNQQNPTLLLLVLEASKMLGNCTYS